MHLSLGSQAGHCAFLELDLWARWSHEVFVCVCVCVKRDSVFLPNRLPCVCGHADAHVPLGEWNLFKHRLTLSSCHPPLLLLPVLAIIPVSPIRGPIPQWQLPFHLPPPISSFLLLRPRFHVSLWTVIYQPACRLDEQIQHGCLQIWLK